MKGTIKIEDYNDTYANAFKTLNLEWIERYFKVEPADIKVLDHPNENILDKGGHILVALLDEVPVGVCALLRSEHVEFDFELAKMAVSPVAQGKGIGFLLGQHIIEKAKELGGSNIFLESNTKLEAAIKLYRKLGFKEIDRISTPYDRCDIQMELVLV